MALPKKILFASTNSGKVEEVKLALNGSGVDIVSPQDFLRDWGKVGQVTPVPIVDENGTTYLENARLKANRFFLWANMPALADDTGLEVAALGGVPGVFSARYAGEGATSQKNREKLLWALRDATDRTAKFCCVLCLKISSSANVEVSATLGGSITREPRGGAGFGYDSVFEVEGTGKTLAELKESGQPIKTHRLLALQKLLGAMEF